MARKRYGLTEARIRRFLHEGRGKGTGKHYKPFWKVSDVPSRGRLHRVFCPKTQREHHLLSDNEYYAFLTLWWDNNVIDIREQYPLDRQETFEIAARCGVPHPIDRHSGAIWVMTTDLLVTERGLNSNREIAFAVKDAEELCNERVLEKLEIERRFWERREIPWHILTDQQVKCTFTKNLSWILDSDDLNWKKLCSLNPDLDLIRHELAEGQRINPQMPMRLLCGAVDQRLGYKKATTLGVLRKLLAEKIVHVDLHTRSLQNLPAQEFSIQGGKE